MTKEQDLSEFAAFDLDDLISEIESNNANKKEATAYLDRSFIVNMINEYNRQAKINRPDFRVDNTIDFTDYNFTGTDLRKIKRKYFNLCNFKGCDISSTTLDRVAIDYFHQYMIEGNLTYQGISFENAYLGPLLTQDRDIGVECYIYLNLSDLNLTGANFKNADIDGLILRNTNISGCNFINARNISLKQFAFSIGFEKARFNIDPQLDQKIKAKIKEYANNLDPDIYYTPPSAANSNKFMSYMAKLTSILD